MSDAAGYQQVPPGGRRSAHGRARRALRAIVAQSVLAAPAVVALALVPQGSAGAQGAGNRWLTADANRSAAGSPRREIDAVAALTTASTATTATTSTAGSGQAPGPSGTPPRRSLPPVRYRPVGCIVAGPVADRFAGPPRREVAVGFDDGPFPLTPQFVHMLRANGAVATFFMIGRQVTPAYRGTLREELRDGDALGDHTWSHPDLVLSDEVASQLRGAREVIRRETGYTPCVFRPPYGSYDASVVSIARSLGLATVTWDVDPTDWALPGVTAIEQRVLAQVRPGSIIISHDGGGPRQETLAAYPYIIRKLHERGYRFVTIPQLLGFRTIYVRCRRRCGGTAIAGRPPAGSVIRAG